MGVIAKEDRRLLGGGGSGCGGSSFSSSCPGLGLKATPSLALIGCFHCSKIGGKFVCDFLSCFFEAGSWLLPMLAYNYVAKDDLALGVFLPPPPGCWVSSCVPSQLAYEVLKGFLCTCWTTQLARRLLTELQSGPCVFCCCSCL